MSEVEEIHKPSPVPILCTHENHNVKTSQFWLVDRQVICDSCFIEHYSELEKCATPGCNEYDEPQNFTNGLCDSCNELAAGIDPQDEEGWRHNAMKWNET